MVPGVAADRPREIEQHIGPVRGNVASFASNHYPVGEAKRVQAARLADSNRNSRTLRNSCRPGSRPRHDAGFVSPTREFRRDRAILARIDQNAIDFRHPFEQLAMRRQRERVDLCEPLVQRTGNNRGNERVTDAAAGAIEQGSLSAHRRHRARERALGRTARPRVARGSRAAASPVRHWWKDPHRAREGGRVRSSEPEED